MMGDSTSRRRYGTDDRRQQLRHLAAACDRLSEVYGPRKPDLAAVYRSIRDEAHRLDSSRFMQEELTALSRHLPERPDWLNPRYHEYQLPREPWQDELALAAAESEAACLELRSLGAYEHPPATESDAETGQPASVRDPDEVVERERRQLQLMKDRSTASSRVTSRSGP